MADYHTTCRQCRCAHTQIQTHAHTQTWSNFASLTADLHASINSPGNFSRLNSPSTLPWQCIPNRQIQALCLTTVRITNLCMYVIRCNIDTEKCLQMYGHYSVKILFINNTLPSQLKTYNWINLSTVMRAQYLSRLTQLTMVRLVQNMLRVYANPTDKSLHSCISYIHHSFINPPKYAKDINWLIDDLYSFEFQTCGKDRRFKFRQAIERVAEWLHLVLCLPSCQYNNTSNKAHDQGLT